MGMRKCPSFFLKGKSAWPSAQNDSHNLIFTIFCLLFNFFSSSFFFSLVPFLTTESRDPRLGDVHAIRYIHWSFQPGGNWSTNICGKSQERENGNFSAFRIFNYDNFLTNPLSFPSNTYRLLWLTKAVSDFSSFFSRIGFCVWFLGRKTSWVCNFPLSLFHR